MLPSSVEVIRPKPRKQFVGLIDGSFDGFLRNLFIGVLLGAESEEIDVFGESRSALRGEFHENVAGGASNGFGESLREILEAASAS